MKNIMVLAWVFSSLCFAVSFEEARLVAAKYLNTDQVKMDNESKKSYFFITELEYKPGDETQEWQCFRGVVVSKKTGEVVDPSSDKDITISFPYSDTHQEGFVIINCAD
ncbi:MAG: hypothetical protein A2381_15405 [Bdellovibrionales bacterium RIFOXYB1_FULL_37_110]|nr:MAG: hypothetical protein A2417_07255 [Bdellovibrionales bacterium RIFOXYC1_FULL_37_79]OFZ57009.1 MAG: hypothetical protein A2381_15405 [Bdellovibrionales bacterium RIFOXYB1_FULL_37_110]OFZ64008.1 MAG: hypothetical protein A2577_16020 [Bdellovibrionales bacterium RIFOXYD1_FULL_36_51]